MSLGTLSRARTRSSARRRGEAGAGFGVAAAIRLIVFSLYIGIFIYCTLSALLGPAGLTAYRRLEQRKAAMEANLGELEAIRKDLNAEIESLKNDPDRAALEARSLGYLHKDESAVILGEKADRQKSIDTGTVMPYAEPAAIGDSALKAVSVGASLGMLALLFAPRRRRASDRNR
jgi:cell division protein FtsB